MSSSISMLQRFGQCLAPLFPCCSCGTSSHASAARQPLLTQRGAMASSAPSPSDGVPTLAATAAGLSGAALPASTLLPLLTPPASLAPSPTTAGSLGAASEPLVPPPTVFVPPVPLCLNIADPASLDVLDGLPPRATLSASALELPTVEYEQSQASSDAGSCTDSEPRAQAAGPPEAAAQGVDTAASGLPERRTAPLAVVLEPARSPSAASSAGRASSLAASVGSSMHGHAPLSREASDSGLQPGGPSGAPSSASGGRASSRSHIDETHLPAAGGGWGWRGLWQWLARWQVATSRPAPSRSTSGGSASPTADRAAHDSMG